jgi:hypothetical protein
MLLTSLLACTTLQLPSTDVAPAENPPDSPTLEEDRALSPTRADLLVVVDTTGSMVDLRSTLGALNLLAPTSPLGADPPPDLLRVAVLRAGESDVWFPLGPSGARWLDAADPDAAAAVDAALTYSGRSSASDETLFAFAERALIADTSGFRRDDVPLHLLVVSNEDDASPGRPHEIIEALADLAPAGVVVWGLIGPPGGCFSAVDAARIGGVVEATGGGWRSICEHQPELLSADLTRDALDLPARVHLRQRPDPATLALTVFDRGEERVGLPNDDCQGAACVAFSWDEVTNAVILPDTVPSPEATITLRYRIAP